MGLNIAYQNGQTSLSEEEKKGLLLTHITTHKELNEVEHINIQKAVKWSLSYKGTIDKVMDMNFIKKVHKMMYGDVWKWAGQFRKSEKKYWNRVV